MLTFIHDCGDKISLPLLSFPISPPLIFIPCLSCPLSSCLSPLLLLSLHLKSSYGVGETLLVHFTVHFGCRIKLIKSDQLQQKTFVLTNFLKKCILCLCSPPQLSTCIVQAYYTSMPLTQHMKWSVNCYIKMWCNLICLKKFHTWISVGCNKTKE